MSCARREWDLVIYGATGDAGKAIALYVANNAHNYKINNTNDKNNKDLKWAIAGRSERKLNQLRSQIIVSRNKPSSEEIGVIVAASTDEEALNGMAKSARLVLSAVGPYTTLGEPTVKACVENGTNYVDITGEVDWVLKMKQKYFKRATETGSTLCSFAGYDCIPSELSVYLALKAIANDASSNSDDDNDDDDEFVEVKLSSVETVVKLNGRGTFPRGTIRTSISKLPTMIQFIQDLVNYTPPNERTNTAKSLFFWLFPKWSSFEDSEAGGAFTVPHFMGWCNIPVVHNTFTGNIVGGRGFNDRMVLPLSDKVYTGYGLVPIVVIYWFLLAFAPLQIFFFILVMIFPSIADLILKLFDSIQYRGNTTNNQQLLENASVECTTTAVPLSLSSSTSCYNNDSEIKAAVVRFFCQGDAGILCTALLASETAFAMLDVDDEDNNNNNSENDKSASSSLLLPRGVFGSPASLVGDRLIERFQQRDESGGTSDCYLDVKLIRGSSSPASSKKTD